MGHSEHQKHAQDHGPGPQPCAVITVSDTRTFNTDSSGRLIVEALQGAGHHITFYEIVRDEPDQIAALLRRLAGEVRVILLTGGTGITPRDTTYEAVEALLEKRLPGFGELFRMLSYEEIGAAAMLSRATAGVYRGTLVFSMPGSSAAVRLALEKLIMPELDHMLWSMLGQT